MNVPAEHFSRPFRVGVAEDAFLYLPYRKGSAREGIGNCPIILKVQIVDELIAQSRATIERSDEPLKSLLIHRVSLLGHEDARFSDSGSIRPLPARLSRKVAVRVSMPKI